MLRSSLNSLVKIRLKYRLAWISKYEIHWFNVTRVDYTLPTTINRYNHINDTQCNISELTSSISKKMSSIHHTPEILIKKLKKKAASTIKSKMCFFLHLFFGQCVLVRHLRLSPGAGAGLRQASQSLLQGMSGLVELGEECTSEGQTRTLRSQSELQDDLQRFQVSPRTFQARGCWLCIGYVVK